MYLKSINTLTLKDYFNSLLKELIKQKLINEKEIELIYIQIKDLFVLQSKRFTLGDSSSIPEETAIDLIDSILYTIGIELQSSVTLEIQADILKSQSISKLFYKGQEKIEKMLKKARLYHLQNKKFMLKLDILAYNDTLTTGLDIFFKEYNFRFFAHFSPGSIDYPLALDKMDTEGIQYTVDYLKKSYLENILCKCIDEKVLLRLLDNYDRNYSVLLFNIFNVILNNIIGCLILDKNPIIPLLNEDEYSSIYNRLLLYEDVDYQTLYNKTLNFILPQNLSEDRFSKDYIHSVLIHTLNNLKVYIEEKDYYSFFTYDKPKNKNKLYFKDNENLDDELFRSVLKELLTLRYTQDKINMLNEYAKSIQDLIDFLSNDVFSYVEYSFYFSTLNTENISLLVFNGILRNRPIEDNFMTQLKDIETSFKWEDAIIDYIKTRNDSMIEEIKSFLLSLENIE